MGWDVCVGEGGWCVGWGEWQGVLAKTGFVCGYLQKFVTKVIPTSPGKMYFGAKT